MRFQNRRRVPNKKQACGFAYARAITLQEVGHNIKLKSDLFKKLMSGEVLPGRCNYGKEALCFSWKDTVFFWGVNSEVPMVRITNPCDEQLWKPYLRRINIIELRATFTPDDDLVDEANHVYLEDCKLRGF